MITIFIVLTAVLCWIGYTYYLCKKKADAVHATLTDFKVKLLGVGSSAEAAALYSALKTYGDIHCQWVFFDVSPEYLRLLGLVTTEYDNFRRQEERLRRK